jgi:hypothetical protein
VPTHGVGVVVRVALDEGGLTGQITPDTTFPAGDFRSDRKAPAARRVDALRAEPGLAEDQVAATALRFVLVRRHTVSGSASSGPRPPWPRRPSWSAPPTSASTAAATPTGWLASRPPWEPGSSPPATPSPR